MEAMKVPEGEMVEGREAFERFDATMQALVAVPRSVLLRREKAYKKRSLQNPNRRGPKPKSGQVLQTSRKSPKSA
jgi:hypothetical protein